MNNPFEDIITALRRLEQKVDRQNDFIAKMQVSTDDKIDIEQASKVINLAKSTIYQLVHKGEIPYFKRGRKLLFSKDALSDWRVEKGVTNSDIDDELDGMFKAS